MRKDRLLKLADYLETVPRERFDMNIIAEGKGCGFSGCAIGWAIHGRLFRGLRFDRTMHITVYKDIEGAPGIDVLFDAPVWDELFHESLGGTPKQAAKRIRKYVSQHEKELT